MTCRAVFVTKPDRTLALSLLYPATTGRNFDEILRAIDSLQLTATHSVATPAGWTPKTECMVVPTLSDAQAAAQFGSGDGSGFRTLAVPSGKGYMRLTRDPSAAAQ